MPLLTVLSTLGVAVCTSLVYLVLVVYTHRRKINELRKQGVPMPKEWSWVTGHLLVLQKYLDKMPPDAAVAFAMRELCREYADTEVFLMDVWPVYPALFTLFGPGPIHQICNKYNLPKTATAALTMRPVTGGPSLISMNGDEWKFWRSLFNPGFSTGAMFNNVPHVVDSVLVFREQLIEKVGRGMFSLDELTTRLTTEVILKVTLDDDLNYQRSAHVLPSALGTILRWHSFWDPRVLMHPLRPFIQRYNGYIINRYIRKELQKQFEEIKRSTRTDDSGRSPKTIKSVVTLALETYLAEGEGAGDPKDVLDEKFAAYAASQIRLFLFAGTDTSSSLMVYTYHMLSKHPEWLARLRKEHDEVFGFDTANAAGSLKGNPSLLNDCKLTLAVVKETLRLHAPAGTLRAGLPGITITDLQGNEQPVEYVGVNVLHQALHLNPRVWPRASEFLPDRFLVGPEHELYPDQAAYRPFEQGPRNCIGQTLVFNELRIGLILTCRDLEISNAYSDFDAQKEREMGIWGRLKRKVVGEPIRTVNGDRAYQTDSGGLHPVDGFPCYVKWAEGHKRQGAV
ncbi:putative cytochrome P450 [Xylariaceae sp. FL0804]|nr:putative cytochrome P450 [Xylariaceae sp. FL0804]